MSNAATVPVSEVTLTGTGDGEGFCATLAQAGLTMELWGDGHVQIYRTDNTGPILYQGPLAALLPATTE